MAKSKGRVKNNMKSILDRLEHKVQSELNRAAIEAKDDIQQDLASGAHGLLTDTGGAEASIYVIRYVRSREQNDHAEAVSAMASQMRDRYDEGHIARRTLDAYELEVPPGHLQAAVSSCSLVMAWWEDGHDNQFLGGEKVRRPHFRPMMLNYGAGEKRISNRFQGILRHKD